MILLVSIPKSFASERRYAVELVLTHCLGLKYRLTGEDCDDVRLRMEGDASQRAVVVRDIFFRSSADSWLEPASLPRLPLARWRVSRDFPEVKLVDADRLPVLFGEEILPGTYAATSGETLELGLDIFGGAFFAVTRYEEATLPDQDAHLRFPSHAAVAARDGFLDRPIANEYAAVLLAALLRVWPRLQARRNGYRLALSHDVDTPTSLPRTSARLAATAVRDALVWQEPGLALRRVGAARRPDDFDRDPCNTFKLIMDTSEHHGVRSTFFFLTEASAGPYGSPYDVSTLPIRRLLRRIHERGHEIGLHGSYDSYDDVEMLGREFKSLVDTCDAEGIGQEHWGLRQHYLRWANPRSWQNAAEVGLAYDSTLSFAHEPGFRAGICTRYPVFNLRTSQRLELYERPLIAMEGSLLDKHYLGLSPDAAFERVTRLVDACRAVDGEFVLLWHNNRLIRRREAALYQQIVEYARP